MRITLIFSCLLINLTIYCQIWNYEDPVIKGNVKFMIEKSCNFKDYQEEYSFDSLSRIIEIKYFRNEELVTNTFFSYTTINDSVLTVTETNKAQNKIDSFYSKYYYNSEKRIVRWELYVNNSSTPDIVELNAKYENGKIVEYDRILISKDTSIIQNYKFTYLGNKVIIKEIDNKQISHITTTLKYNKKGNLINKIVDYNDPKCIISDIRTYSRFRYDKYKIKYKYDNAGNWIQSYSITQFWKYKRRTREIIYK